MTRLADIARSYNDACSHGSIEEVRACFTEDAVIYDLNHPPVVGRQAIGRFWEHVRDKWGGATWDSDVIVDDGTRVTVEWTMHGLTGEGPFAFRGVDVFEFEGERISEIRQYWRFDESSRNSGLVGYSYP